MAVDPRTPVLVGTGQVTVRPGDAPPDQRPEPLDLMERALRAAAESAGGHGDRLLARMDSLRVVASMGWRTPDPAAAVAERLAVRPGQLLRSATGGTMPLALLHDAASAIQGGDLDVVGIVGAECLHSTSSARRRGEPRPRWTEQPEGTPSGEVFGEERAPATELEQSRGLQLPIQAYPLLENALRAARGWTVEEHRRRIGALWSRFSEVAAANPHAWSPEAVSPADIVEPGPANRMVAFPYTKLCTSNIQVDQGAGFLVCSAEAARRYGVPEERWVFPLAGAEASDHWFLSERVELSASPAIRLVGRAVLEAAGAGMDDVGPIDLYSCFPVVVQMAAAELGLPVDDPRRPLTLTGGLTFGGGPGNNYVSHSVAAMVDRLRQAAAPELGLVTGLGWYATKHAATVLSNRPHPPGRPWRWCDRQAEVDALPKARWSAEVTGPVTVETFTVLFGRDGRPEQGLVVCRDPGGVRGWGSVGDRGALDELAEAAEKEAVGRPGRLEPDGTFRLEA